MIEAIDLRSPKPSLGCVLAIQDRPAESLERTLETYAYQSFQPADRVLVDYGSEQAHAAAYRQMCARFAWRYVRAIPAKGGWSLSAAYNIAVSALREQVDIVFKSDIDVLMGRDALQTAAVMAGDKLCLFSCLATAEGSCFPKHFTCHEDLVSLFLAPAPPTAMLGEGVHAYPRKWFEEIGGFDLQFHSWGYEDSDLRARAERSIGTTHASAPLLIHQWHPASVVVADARRNRARYDQLKHDGPIVRNGGRAGLVPSGVEVIKPKDGALAGARGGKLKKSLSNARESGAKRLRVAFACRSMNDILFRQASALLGLDCLPKRNGFNAKLYRMTGTDSMGYFRELSALDADWVVNFDEDVFVLDPERLFKLLRFMKERRYAACGMPDGGVVEMRRHNPVACNAFFNIFDLRRVRGPWQNWEAVKAARHKTAYEQAAPPFARRTPFAFDDFEPYYGLSYTLLDAGEKILYLDAEEWQDGVTTLLKDAEGEPLLLHGWYSRTWELNTETRERFRLAVDYVFRRGKRN